MKTEESMEADADLPSG